MRHVFLATMAAVGMLMAAIPAMAQDKPTVIAVNYPLHYIAQRLFGGDAEVVYPVPEGVDPSFWRPGIADISAVQAADLILLNGAGFATWTSKVSLPRSALVDTSRGIADRLIATESITHSHGEGGEHSHEGTASYTWLDPKMAVEQASAVADAIKARGLDDPAQVDARLAALSDDLTALDEAARAALANTGETVFIATHPRYQYLARAYDLRILSLEWDAGATPNEDDVAQLRALAEKNRATVLIWEAAPSEASLQMATNLGLQNVIFPPLAVPPSQSDLIEALKASIKALADAAAQTGTE